MGISLVAVSFSILSAVLWGLYPVLARLIMLHQAREIPATSVLAAIALGNTLLIGLYYTYTKYRHTSENLTEKEGADVDARKRRNVALAYGSLCVARMVTNMQSCRMTKAYLTQMAAMSLPFFTAILAKLFLKEQTHPSLVPALSLMVAGSLMVLQGQGAFSGESSSDFSTDDVYGILLQLLSVVLSAMLKIAFKSTETILTKVELLLSQFTITAVPLLAYSLAFERESFFYVLYGLDPVGFAALLVMTFGVYLLGNWLQIAAVRQLGASNHSVSNSIRLVSAVVGSSYILHEYLQGSIGYVGIALIMTAVSGYWYAVHFHTAATTSSAEASDGDVDLVYTDVASTDVESSFAGACVAMTNRAAETTDTMELQYVKYTPLRQ